MSIRLHLGSADLANVRLAPGLSPFIETAGLLRRRGRHSRGVRQPLLEQSVDVGKLEMLSELTGYVGCHPGFVCSAATNIDAAIDRFLGLPSTVILEDLTDVAATGRRLPVWTQALVGRDLRPRLELASAMQHVYHRMVEPVLTAGTHVAVLDRRHRAQLMADHGVGRLLSSLHPRIRWNGSVLDIHLSASVDFDLDVGGRGVQLTPTLIGDVAVSNIGTDEDAVIVDYPIRRAAEVAPRISTEDALGAVMGSVRAAALRCVRDSPGVGTRAIAALLGVAPSTASEQLKALRAAGLITTIPGGRRVAHHLTPVGADVVS